MMLKYSFTNDKAANDIETAVKSVLKQGYRTKDIYSENTVLTTTSQIGDLIVTELLRN